jgi:hypothetical protein
MHCRSQDLENRKLTRTSNPQQSASNTTPLNDAPTVACEYVEGFRSTMYRTALDRLNPIALIVEVDKDAAHFAHGTTTGPRTQTNRDRQRTSPVHSSLKPLPCSHHASEKHSRVSPPFTTLQPPWTTRSWAIPSRTSRQPRRPTTEAPRMAGLRLAKASEGSWTRSSRLLLSPT